MYTYFLIDYSSNIFHFVSPHSRLTHETTNAKMKRSNVLLQWTVEWAVELTDLESETDGLGWDPVYQQAGRL